MSELITFTVAGRPVPKGRPRFMKNGHVFTPESTLEYEALVAQSAMIAMIGKKPIETGVWLTVTAYISGKRKPDLDNVVKAISDACNAICYLDDSLIYRIIAERRDCTKDEQRVEVVIMAKA